VTTIRDFLAGVRIALGNFWYDYGAWFYWIVGAAVVLFLGMLTLRAFRCRTYYAGRYKLEKANDEKDERIAGHLSAAVRFPTVTGEQKPLRELTEYLKKTYPLVFSRMKMDTLEGGSLLLCWQGEKSGRLPILFAGHLDVVPATGQWTHPPFSGERADGCVWGRGTIDCKHVVITLLETAERLLAEGYLPKRDIYFAFGHDEETGGDEGAAALADLLALRGVKLEMVLDEGGAIVNGYAGNRSAAAALVGVTEKGMCNLKLTVSGTPGHASAPGRHTAAGLLSEAVCRLESTPFRKRTSPLTRRTLKQSAGCMYFFHRLLCANLPLTEPLCKAFLAKRPQDEALFRTTMAVTVLQSGHTPNVLPDEASAIVNIRLLHGDTIADAQRYVEDLTADLSCKVELINGVEPSGIADYEHEAFDMLRKTVQERFGAVPVIPNLFAGRTDGRRYEMICDAVFRFMPFVLSPQQLSRMHGEDERIPEECLGAASEFYEALIRRFC